MTIKDEGGFAFPKPDCDQMEAQGGMTLRDWFAGQALAGLMSVRSSNVAAAYAADAYKIADLMILERAKFSVDTTD